MLLSRGKSQHCMLVYQNVIEWEFYYVPVLDKMKPPNHNNAFHTTAWQVSVYEQQRYRKMLFQLHLSLNHLEVLLDSGLLYKS